MGVAAALMVMLIFPQTLWAPYGGIGGVPVPQELEDLTDVEASSLASDQDAVVWNSATQSYIHTAVSGGSGDMTKAVYDADNNAAIDDTAIPDDITIDLAATATALAADGANCAAGNYPLGVDASGAVQDCTALGGGGDMTKAVYDADNNSAIDDTAIPAGIARDSELFGGNFSDLEGSITDAQTPDDITITGLGVATSITDGLIVEADLDADEAPTDNDILTYDTTGANFSWQTPNELAIVEDSDVGVSVQAYATTLDDIADGTIEIDDFITFDTGLAYNNTTNTLTIGAILKDINDGTIATNLVNTANPWAENEIVSTVITETDSSAWDHTTSDDYTVGGTDVPITDGGTGASTAAAAKAALDTGIPLESRTIGGTALTAHTLPIHKAGVDITITDFGCITDTGTVVFELLEGSGTGYTGGTTVDGTITCDTNEQQDDGTLANGTIDANDYIAARFGTETSSPTIVQIWWKYTVD